MNRFKKQLFAYEQISKLCYSLEINPMPLLRSDMRHKGLSHYHIQYVNHSDLLDDAGIYVVKENGYIEVVHHQHHDLLSHKRSGMFYDEYRWHKAIGVPMTEPLWGYGYKK